MVVDGHRVRLGQLSKSTWQADKLGLAASAPWDIGCEEAMSFIEADSAMVLGVGKESIKNRIGGCRPLFGGVSIRSDRPLVF
jgi:hypothetical protein